MDFVYGFLCGSLFMLLLTAVYHIRKRDRENKRSQQAASRIYSAVERNRSEGQRIAEEASAAGATVEDILNIVSHRVIDDSNNFNNEG